RKTTILKTIASQGKLTPELQTEIEACTDKQHLEDLYLPYKPKRRTRAIIAREKGLEPLADFIWQQQNDGRTRSDILTPFVNVEKNVATEDDARAGAQDIIAERIAEEAAVRDWLRKYAFRNGVLTVSVRKDWKDKPSKFQDYYDYQEALNTIPHHRLLAVRRGEKEGVLSTLIELDDQRPLQYLVRQFVRNPGFIFHDALIAAIEDGYTRLLFPSISNAVWSEYITAADLSAIEVFASNARNLLLAPPAGQRRVMGIDPGFRTGCKLAILDETGKFLDYGIIHLHNETAAIRLIPTLLRKHKIDIIAIGNGTAGRETEALVKRILNDEGMQTPVVMVNEAGASVYSASEEAREEFPDLDLTVRGAISIGRRLQDPLAELVKIDPKSIGVGQYQHDVNQKELKNALDNTVMLTVNRVGVNLNTASKSLLKYVSGLGSTLAENIVKYRENTGRFHQRRDLLKVPLLGPKAFEQAAGFLRIPDGKNPLDRSAVHPERYPVVESMAKKLGVGVTELVGDTQRIEAIPIQEFVTDEVGLPTLKDIIAELKKPGLDPRDEFVMPQFMEGVNAIEDLTEGMILEGTVTNVTQFGAFVDVGVHQDGLVHISQLANRFVKDPAEIVSVGQIVKVKVMSVDVERKRIGLSMKAVG
ncbi:MAG: RNA-binding transcriptional accessory protein, partial [Candidatus Marinimicrobia bacterium]|nr:RNA-binding transcriptional accessory protein [Candidatus Neomarinimicrobiota bacterium]MCF7839911.1 RNA-binding transcriptional accessory protein [Candidatus Neomarinimicrobiota bacterium]